MYFGVFGSIFLLPSSFRRRGATPLHAGQQTLPWTGMPMIVAPIAGILGDRIGSRPLMASGLALQAAAIAWLAAILTPTPAYDRLIVHRFPRHALGGSGARRSLSSSRRG